LKEIQFSPTTQLHDIKHKINRVPEWLSEGEKVKLTCKFSGREATHPETGIELFDKIFGLLPDAQVDKVPKLEGKVMWTVLSRKSTKGLAVPVPAKIESKKLDEKINK
jgi:translation initiation factor IF-3